MLDNVAEFSRKGACMVSLITEEVVRAIDGELITGNLKTFSGVSIDSRTISDDELFFAIRGDKFDGHDFLDNALVKGSGAVVDSAPDNLPDGKAVIRVNDTLRSLQDLARFLRMRLDVPVVAITGSNGKTTTKEMIYTIMSTRFRTLKNEGNLNNHIGLPLSLMKLDQDDEAIVLEMGMNAQGEIRRLCEIAVPSHGVITNIGPAHVGRLGSYEAVRDAKLEILEGLSVAVANADDDFLIKGINMAKEYSGQVTTFAINNDAHVTAKNINLTEKGSSFVLYVQDKGAVPINLHLYGRFNIYNALAAASVCSTLGMKIDEIKSALESFSGSPMRFEISKIGGVTLINDAYNANPASVEESLKEAVRLGAGNRVAVILGDMHELDDFSEIAHRGIGQVVFEIGVDVFLAVGDMMRLAAEECVKLRQHDNKPEVFMFKDIRSAGEKIMDILETGDTVLVKGSRAMAMERIIGDIVNAL
jgi:UDP-N-acetylmuramoyl-tripeptide--D-alanyl-D-alanine ligase